MRGELCYNGKFVKVTEEQIGSEVFERVYLKGAVIVFAVTGEGKFIFVKEKRVHETPNIRLKPVTGFFETEFDWKENAQRELREEIGMSAGSLERFMHFEHKGSIISHKHFILAKELKVDPLPNPDGDVILETVELSLEEMLLKSLSKEIPPVMDSLGIFWIYHLVQAGKLNLYS